MIAFGDNTNWKWLVESEVIEFTILIDDAPVICRVSRECLEDHCGNPKTPGEFLDAAKVYFDAITDRIQNIIRGRGLEPDGSILVRSADW